MTTRTQTYKQGYLTKQGGSTKQGGWKTWKKRWFVLHNEGVSYYKTREGFLSSQDELGFLHREEAFEVTESFTDLDRCLFIFKNKTRTLHVKAANEKLKEEWLSAWIAMKKDLQSSVVVSRTQATELDSKREERVEKLLKFVPTTEGVIFSGYMSKQGHQRKNWKVRFFILLQNDLSYYKHHKETNAHGSISLSPLSVASVHGELMHAFVLISKPQDPIYNVIAKDDKERLHWLQALHLAQPNMKIFYPQENDKKKFVAHSHTTITQVNSKSIKEGYLLKIGTQVAKWKRRYFVLLSEKMEYYKDPRDKTPHNVVSLGEGDKAGPYADTNFFLDLAGKRTFVLSAADNEERTAWLSALQKASEKMKVTFPVQEWHIKEMEKILAFILSSTGKAASTIQQQFVEYCQRARCEENARFCLAVEQFKRAQDNDDEQKKTLASQIYAHYLADSAEERVGLTPPLEKDIEKKRKALFDTPPPTLFCLPTLPKTPPPSMSSGTHSRNSNNSGNHSGNHTNAPSLIPKPPKPQRSASSNVSQTITLDLRQLRLDDANPSTPANGPAKPPRKAVEPSKLPSPSSSPRASREEYSRTMSFSPSLLNESPKTTVGSRTNVALAVPDRPPPSRPGMPARAAPRRPDGSPSPRAVSPSSATLRPTSPSSSGSGSNRMSRPRSVSPSPKPDLSVPVPLATETTTTLEPEPERKRDDSRLEFLDPPALPTVLPPETLSGPEFANIFDNVYRYVFTLLRDAFMPNFMMNIPESEVRKWGLSVQADQDRIATDILAKNDILRILCDVSAKTQGDRLDFRRTFLLHYHSFANTAEVLTFLIAVYDETSVATPDIEFAVSSKVHLASLLEEWAANYFCDFGPQVLLVFSAVVGWLDQAMKHKPGTNALVSKLLDLRERLDTEELANDGLSRSQHDESTLQIAAFVDEVHLFGEDFLAASPEQVAGWLTVFDYYTFRKLKPREFVNKGWTREETRMQTSPNLMFMIRQYTQRGYWAASEIMRAEGPVQAIKLLTHFIHILDKLAKYRNFFGVFALANGLSLAPVGRLKYLMQGLGAKEKKIWENTMRLTDGKRNYYVYRDLLKKGLGSPQIPHIAVTLKDCFQCEEISTLGGAGKVNFHKFEKQFLQISDLFRSQEAAYGTRALLSAEGDVLNSSATEYDEMRSEGVVQALLPAFEGANCLDEEQLWARSYQLMSRDSKVPNPSPPPFAAPGSPKMEAKPTHRANMSMAIPLKMFSLKSKAGPPLSKNPSQSTTALGSLTSTQPMVK